jgi:hypothetical protein
MQKHQIQQALITACIWALILSVESKSALFAYQTQATMIEGVQFAAITLLGAILAAFGFTLVGQLKADERPRVRRGAWAVRLIAVTFLLFPIWFFGSSVKLHNAQVSWDAYAASQAIEVDRALAAQATLTISEQTVDAWEIQEAARRLVRPTNANLSPLDGEFYFALILLSILNFAAEKFRVPAPITAEERMQMMFKERGRKAAATRKARKAQRNVVKPLFGAKKA